MDLVMFLVFLAIFIGIYVALGFDGFWFFEIGGFFLELR